MNKLHTYMLPIAAGAFALMLSPLAETTAVVYSLIGIIVITGIVGLQALAKNNEATNENNEQVVQCLEQLKAQIEHLVQASNKQGQLAEQQSADQLTFAKDLKQHYTTLVKVTTEQASNVIEQTKQQTETLSDNLRKVQTHIDTLQQTMTNHLVDMEDKVDEGNKVLENVSVLMVKELQAVNHNMEELVSLQSTLPNELDNLQDVISSNQEQLIDGTRDLESQLEVLKDITTTHYNRAEQSHGEVISRISEEFTVLSNAVQQETSLLIEQASQTAKAAENQLIKATDIILNIENISKELKKANVTNNEKVGYQLTHLSDISESLLQGIAQLTNSQSTERKQLLSIQKRLISKYSKSLE